MQEHIVFSGLNIVAQITDLVLGIAVGLLSAATVMIAQYVGAGKEKEIHLRDIAGSM